MFIVSFKAQNLKLGLSLAVSAVAVALVVTLVPSRAARMTNAGESAPVQEVSAGSDKVKDNDSRVAYLNRLGWDVEKEAREVKEIQVPEAFDPTFQSYNDLQKSMGYDLEEVKGKTIRRYTYLVNNYEYDGEVLADLLIYKDRVVGGDLRSAAVGGFMISLAKEAAFPLE